MTGHTNRQMLRSISLRCIIAAAALIMGACAGSQVPVSSTPAGGDYRASRSAAGEYAPAPASASSAPPSGEAPRSMDAEQSAGGSDRSESVAPSAAPSERPGLGTAWGEQRHSQVRHVPFDRANLQKPTTELAVFYNDRSGAKAMTRYGDYRSISASNFNAADLDVSVSLLDDSGEPLPALFANGRLYAIGESGQRYTLSIKNRTGLRLEVVASVDGLDVLDGKAASPSKRGYLVPAHGSVQIAGWRTSADHVAAFRLSSVRDSYAARTGPDRNVGVIGVAFFHEQGTEPRHPWTDEEVQKRHNANPFPDRYASPPPPVFR